MKSVKPFSKLNFFNSFFEKYLLLCFLVLMSNAINAQIPSANLQMWYKADVGYSSVAYPATRTDQSANGNDLKTIDFYESPKLLSDGTNQFLRFITTTGMYEQHFVAMHRSSAVAWAGTNTGISIFMVYKLNSSLVAGCTAGVQISGYAFMFGQTASPAAFISGSTHRNIFSPSNQKEVGSAIFTPNIAVGSQLFINGALRSEASTTGVGLYSPISSIHILSDGVDWNGGSIDIYEVIAYSAPLSTSERQQVESYLGTKYNIGIALPLTLLNFSGQLQQDNIVFQWQTENETGTSEFEIESSTDGDNFKKIGEVASQNSIGNHKYSFSESNIVWNSSPRFYRLKMIDKDGKFKYSSVIKLTNRPSTQLTISPNPAKNIITINRLQQNGIISLFTTEGKLLKKQTVTTQSVTLDMSPYSKGIYLLQYIHNSGATNVKIVKE